MSLKGPLWARFFVLGDEDKAAKELAVVLKAYKATRMIVGHTAAAEGVTPSHGDRLIQIDVGLTAMYGGPAACLVIEKDQFYEVRGVDAFLRIFVAMFDQLAECRFRFVDTVVDEG